MTTDAGSELRELLAQAEDAVANLEDEELRKIAFERVLDYLIGGNGGAQPSLERPEIQAAVTVKEADSSLATEQQRVDAAAQYFGIEPEQVRDMFDLTGDVPKLALHSAKLPSKKATAAQSIALLVCGVRTALGMDTSSSDIRDVASEFGKLDSSNFMKTLGNMDEIAMVGRPRSPNRLVRMRVVGTEAARALAQKLVA